MGEKIPHWLETRAETNHTQLAIESPTFGKLTFGQLRDQARQLAQQLHQLGVKQGEHVAIYTDNRFEFIVTIHALSYIKAVAILLNTRLTRKEIEFQLIDAEATFLLIEKGKQKQGEAFSTISELTILTLDEVAQAPIASLDFEQLEIDMDDIYTIVYTSGTTGKPKGVLHTYGNHWWSAIASMLNLGLNADDKWLSILPLFHVGGFSLLMKNIIYGMPIYMLDHFDPKKVNHAIMQQGVTIVSVVSIMLERLMEQLADMRYPSSFRGMLLGGGPASPQLLRRATKLDIPVFQTYGMTETASQIATLSPKDALRKRGSAGKALFSAQVKVMKHDKAAQAMEIGELFVKGPMVTSGYYKRKLTMDQGWLPTGDLGYLDSEGYLYIVDRRNDLIISGGENVYPAEVEHILTDIKGVLEAGVVGKADEKWGKVPIAFLVVDASFDLEETKQQCYELLAKYKVPKAFYIVDDLPRNASNKLLRHQLASML